MAARKNWIVKAEAVVINVGKQAERYIYKGAVVPAEVAAEELKRLVARGLVVEGKDAPADPNTVPPVGVGTPPEAPQTPPAPPAQS
jgi:hypothetical protein